MSAGSWKTKARPHFSHLLFSFSFLPLLFEIYLFVITHQMEYVLRKGYADNRLKASNPSNYMCREWCSHWEMVHLVNAVCHLFSGLHTAPAFFLPHQSVLAATSLAVAMASFVHQNDERGEKGQHQLIQRVQKSIAFSITHNSQSNCRNSIVCF